MCVRHFGLFFLLFSGGARALSVFRRCHAPKLERGFFVTEQNFYPPETTLSYACDVGYKPAVEGWWASITCVNRKWSDEPRCIDVKACLPPSIPNSKFAVEPSGFYEEGDVLYVKCEDGYKHRGNDATAVCEDGRWTSVPVCEKDIISCYEPPQIPHAVITHQARQDVFAVDSQLQYECEGGYSLEGGNTRENITCISGNWTEASPCRKRSSPGTGSDGSAGGAAGGAAGDPAGGGATTSAGSGTPPLSGGNRPGSGQDGSAAGGGQGGQGGQGGDTGGGAGSSGSRPSTGVGGGGAGGRDSHAGGGTSSGGTRPSTGGSSEASEDFIHITTTDRCGRYPRVRYGDVVEDSGRYLKYRCASFYKRAGPDKVVCLSNGKWTREPICKAVFCSVDTSDYPLLEAVGVKIVQDGQTVRFRCEDRDEWTFDHYSEGRCRDGKMKFTRCCNWWDFKWGC